MEAQKAGNLPADQEIIGLFEGRDEEAIRAAERQYGSLCRRIAMNVVGDAQDAEECVSDTWLAVWNSIPPERPRSLSAFVCRITKNLAMNRLNYLRAEKRDRAASSSLDAMMELNDDPGFTDLHLEAVSEDARRRAINDFLSGLPKESRQIFLRRYWFGDSLSDLSALTGYSESKLKSMFHRMRKGLRQRLEEEGVQI